MLLMNIYVYSCNSVIFAFLIIFLFLQDDTTKCKKIKFDNDIDEQQDLKSKKEKRDLFDNNSDNEDSLLNGNEFNIKENKYKKVRHFLHIYIISFLT